MKSMIVVAGAAVMLAAATSPAAAQAPATGAIAPIIVELCSAGPQPEQPGVQPLQVLGKFDFDGGIATDYVCMAGTEAPRGNLSVSVVLMAEDGAAIGSGASAPACLPAAKAALASPLCQGTSFVVMMKNKPRCPTGPASCPAPGTRPATAEVTVSWREGDGAARKQVFTVPAMAI